MSAAPPRGGLTQALGAMRKIPTLLVAFLIASCGGEERQPIQKPQASEQPISQLRPPPPPLPPLPGSSFKPIAETQALDLAKRKGAGDCSDLRRIQGLPIKKQFGFDPHYDRIMVHIDSYEQCLLQATSSTTATQVEASYPGVSIETVGDLAFVLLVDGEKVKWGECSPTEVIEQENKAGSFAFYSWLKQAGSREQWHDCLIRRHGT